MIRNFKNFLLEKAISDDNIEKYDNVLKNINNIKNTSTFLKEMILELKNECSILDNVKVKIDEEDSKKIYLTTKYNSKIEHKIRNIIDILDQSENTEAFETYFKIVYPDGEELSFYPDIEIEKYNLNRIHIPVGLPYILKGLGLGKKIYKSVIDKCEFISSTYLDRAMDAVYVWNSIRKEKDVYSFIFNKKILAISPKLNFNKIEDILLEFFKGLTDEDIILDDDFKDKYLKELRNSEKISWIFNYEIKQK